MSYWFFFSYARLDRDDYLKKFFRDLKQEVRTLSGELNEEAVGFFDADDIEPGAQWQPTLAGALQSSRAFVSIYSPTYFQKDYCGKEWAIFRERQRSYALTLAAGGQEPPLILPVLWVQENKLPQLPTAVSDIQYKHDDFGAVYAQQGLKQLIKLNKHRDKYKQFVWTLADKLVEATKKHNPPPLADLKPLDQVQSAFHDAPGTPPAKLIPQIETSGPRYVQFIYVAEKRDELAVWRKRLDAYGQEGGKDWQPYYPVQDKVGLIAQEVAAREKLFYEEVKLDSGLIQELVRAEHDNKIVVIIVDTWTLKIEKYRKVMREYDEYDDRSFINCAVLVPWNEGDDEAVAERAALESHVQEAFIKRKLIGGAHSFLYPINKPDDLRRELSTALSKARERILEKAEVMRSVESQKLIPKPIISGPGGK